MVKYLNFIHFLVFNFKINKQSLCFSPWEQPILINEIKVNDNSCFVVNLMNRCSVLLNSSNFSFINGRFFGLHSDRDNIISLKSSLVDLQQHSFLSYEASYLVPNFIDFHKATTPVGHSSIFCRNFQGQGKLIISDCLLSCSRNAFKSDAVSSTQTIRWHLKGSTNHFPLLVFVYLRRPSEDPKTFGELIEWTAPTS